jgi:hypothetical protein
MTNGFDKLLRDGLEAATPRDTGECIDAAQLAAWFDGTLTPAERAVVEQHAAACPRCQAMVAALVRTDRPAPRMAWRAPVVRWLVPMAIAASVILLVSLVRSSRLARAPETTAARVEQPTLPPGSQASSSGTATAMPKSADASAPVAAPPIESRAAADQPQSNNGVARKAAGDDARAASSAPAHAASAAGDPAFTPPAPAPPAHRTETAIAGAAAPNAAGAAADPERSVAEERARESAVTSSRASTARPFARGAAESMLMDTVRTGSRGTVLFSPDRSVQWRILGTGQVERSADGLSWQPQALGVNAVLTAGAAPSTAVCWMVGQRGVVLRTTDSGQTWRQVAFPEPIDLLTIVAADDKVATVTAAGGRQWHTTDGGVSWR